jgi:uncharacterized sporulation protein YeaH/YhbH (DUF444 family)
MAKRILKDLERFKRIVRGEIRKNLKELIETGSIVGQKGSHIVKVPIKAIRIPQFRYDPHEQGGIGVGEGEIGEPVQIDQDQNGFGQAGYGPGPHFREVEIELRELAEILGEELELPRIQPKGHRHVLSGDEEYQDISTVGPQALLMKRRAFRKGLLRHLLMSPPPSGETVIVTPIKEDMRYLYGQPSEKPEANCVIIFMRDASGSMSGEKTEIIRQENWWIDLWLRTNYTNVERVYIVHDYEAQEVSEEDFYSLSTGGGTRISSAYELCNRIIDRRYSQTSGTSMRSTSATGELDRGHGERLRPPLAGAAPPQSESLLLRPSDAGRRSPGLHLVKLRERIADDRLVTSIISDREDILRSIKEFLGKGR